MARATNTTSPTSTTRVEELQRIGGTVLAAAAGILFVFSAILATKEAGPFILRTQSLDFRVSAMSTEETGSLPVSMFESRPARNARLDACLSTLHDVMASLPSKLTTVTSIKRGCLKVAEAIVEKSPLEANIWFIAATLAIQLGDLPRGEAYLKASYRTGPTEQWIAERRALFAYPLRPRLSEDLKLAVDRDLSLLLRTERGVNAMAARYVEDPSLRDHLVELAENLDRSNQERFLSRVRGEIYNRQ